MNKKCKLYDAWMCDEILFSDKISSTEKILFIGIVRLTRFKGYCFATNKYIGEKFNLNESTVSRLLKKLSDAGFIRLEFKKNSKNITERKIYICECNETCSSESKEFCSLKAKLTEALLQKTTSPFDENSRHNTLNLNTLKYNTLNSLATKESTDNFEDPLGASSLRDSAPASSEISFEEASLAFDKIKVPKEVCESEKENIKKGTEEESTNEVCADNTQSFDDKKEITDKATNKAKGNDTPSFVDNKDQDNNPSQQSSLRDSVSALSAETLRPSPAGGGKIDADEKPEKEAKKSKKKDSPFPKQDYEEVIAMYEANKKALGAKGFAVTNEMLPREEVMRRIKNCFKAFGVENTKTGLKYSAEDFFCVKLVNYRLGPIFSKNVMARLSVGEIQEINGSGRRQYKKENKTSAYDLCRSDVSYGQEGW